MIRPFGTKFPCEERPGFVVLLIELKEMLILLLGESLGVDK